jgi:DNA (cytosine-5)-methyltransferase 1
MKVLSLFSGVGGFDLGLEAAGMETVFQCEWDKHATSILEHHWPDVPRWGDISTLTGKHILQHAPVIDVVAWGSPCQDLSVAGKRGGLTGERSILFHEGVRIIKELREETNNEYPRISIWENVHGALNSNKGADFGVILDEMAEAGALVQEWRVLDAQYFGVPQRRRRVFLVSVFDTATATRCPEQLLPVREGVHWNPAASLTTRQGAAIETRTGLANGRDIANTISAEIYHRSTVVNQDINNGHLVVGQELPILIDRAAFNQGVNAQYDIGVSDNPVIPPIVARGPHAVFTKSKRAQSTIDNETWVPDQPNPTLNAFDIGDTRATTVIVEEPTFFQMHQSGETRIQTGVMHTLAGYMGTGGNNTPMVVAPAQTTMAVRRLTPIECERLMGWPDNHTLNKSNGTKQSDTQRYKQCGNGIASPVAQWIGEQLVALDNA